MIRAARVIALVAATAAPARAQDTALRVNDIVAVGTHNSYKQAIPPAVMARLIAADPRAVALDYAHRPLTAQLDAGMRQIELDVYRDDAGGRYARAGDGPAMAAPGLKVMHMPGIDRGSSCLTLAACLREVRTWSDAHPDHAAILILVNAKDEASPMAPVPERFDAAGFDMLDTELRSGLPGRRLITPDEVQGTSPTLRDAVLAGGWPTLAQARGRVLVALDEGPAKVALYRGARRALEGRAMFVNTDEASPAAAYLTLNDPVADGPRIAAAVRAGFLVRTRADDGTREARDGDTRRRDAALASGAQYVSTDYPWPDRRLSGYRVMLPGGAAAGCNPVRAATRCTDGPVERLGGYLVARDRPDLTRILPGPPAPGSPPALADARRFVEARALAGSPRWRQAQADVSDDLPARFRDAIGFAIDIGRTPVLARLLARFGADRSAAIGAAKRHWHSARPFVSNDLPICEPRTAALAANGDYPSGHAANGMAFALILAELLPDRATALLARGRDYADSRRVCGSHSASAVEGGLLAAAALVAAAHGSADLRGDLVAARAELNALRPASLAVHPAGDDQ
ncbi:Ca2+-dependent phosphoinositide-specific phospholipase C [Sphingomonas sp. Leaf62]|uniref:Ca2+-dependent phosphoinositide-specific phospholipase C n=1 Tax=Sphingomonas sp. Leaf62 TaxID=1736228 RepID=UPI000B2BC410|nr:Ca2+-dependent phosphoinositide-specific phospholipase C [Sphingomonas sp. Leaf62]